MHLFKDHESAEAEHRGIEEDKPSVGDQVKSQVTSFIQSSLSKSKQEALQAQHDLKHALGKCISPLQEFGGRGCLGPSPDIVPPGPADINSEPRTVEIGWHPVAGATGKWFAQKTMIGKAITERIGKYPDPTQHWAVLVGGYVHELWMDEQLDVIYINEVAKRDEWHTFEVGKTKFNDQALRKAGQMTIHLMREKKKAYNLISNNCQNFAVELLDKIQVGAHKEFATVAEYYKRATNDNEIEHMFKKQKPEAHEALQADAEAHSLDHRQNVVQAAQQVMDANTTKLDDD